MKFKENTLGNTLFTCHSDLDGIMPLVLNHFCNIDFYKEISTNYDERGEHFDLGQLTENDCVLYVDFTPDEEARKIISDNGIYCIIIDHHESQKEVIGEWQKNYNKVKYIYDVTKSGTLLYYEYLCNEDYPVKENKVAEELCNLVSTYDLWQKNSPLWEKAQNLNRLMWKIPNWSCKNDPLRLHKYFIDGQIWKLQNAETFFFNRFEMEKINEDIKKEREILNEFLNKKRRIITRKDKQGNYFSVIKLDKKISAICSLLLEKYRKLDYIICINEYDADSPKISVRSKEHINVLDFKGVKGHLQAGGVENVTPSLCESLWNGEMYELERIES